MKSNAPPVAAPMGHPPAGSLPTSRKRLERLHRSSSTHWVGDGFPVRSVFGYNDLGRELSPFLLLDYAAPTEFPPSPGDAPRGVGAHPHRGFETVTVVYQGELEHRDSTGAGGKIGPGDVQWMTAASGLLHEEFHSADFTHQGGILEMVQLWVNLPARHKKDPPGYQTLLNAAIPRLPVAGGEVRVIAGQYAGEAGPARTFTPIQLWDIRLNAGAELDLPLEEGHTAALLVLHGGVALGQQIIAAPGDLAIFSRTGREMTLQAEKDSVLLLLSGQPIEEPVVGQGPFVMNSREEIRQAFEDFQAGRLGRMPA